MKILLVPIGSAGDVHPFVGLGTALRDRGHQVTLVTNGYFESLVRRVGLDFVPVGTAEEFHAVTGDPDLWDRDKGLGVVARATLRGTPYLYDIIRDRYEPGETVVAAGALAFGVRIAQETLGLPLATIQLQPACFPSVYHAPVLHPWLSRINSVPRSVKRLLFRLTDFVGDRIIGPETNAFRAGLGLAPTRRFVSHWWNSPERVIGLFPDWFGPPQPDWPPQTVLTGFVLYDESDVAAAPPEAEQFLESGDPPIVFTPGSAMRFGRQFLEASVDACRLLRRRGILLTRYREQVPERLPEEVRHFAYVPLSQLLPRAAALVHHGGVGTLAQGLAAGRPQLIMPLTHDQPDNAIRLRRLGVARALKPAAYRGPAVARELEHLLNSPEVAACCRTAADNVRAGQAVERACDAIEQLSRPTS